MSVLIVNHTHTLAAQLSRTLRHCEEKPWGCSILSSASCLAPHWLLWFSIALLRQCVPLHPWFFGEKYHKVYLIFNPEIEQEARLRESKGRADDGSGCDRSSNPKLFMLYWIL